MCTNFVILKSVQVSGQYIRCTLLAQSIEVVQISNFQIKLAS